MAMYKKALALQPEHDTAFLELLCMLDKHEEYALEAIKETSKNNPFNDKIHGGIATFYFSHENYMLADEYYEKANALRLRLFNPATLHNYNKIKEKALNSGIKLVCVQYPVRSIASLKKLLEPHHGAIFVDNESPFKNALRKKGYKKIFRDNFGGDFGHCTWEGNRLLAGNIANVILKEVFFEKSA